MKVMIVDDEADIREILCFNLEAGGFETVEAPTAEAALKYIRTSGAPDLILLDIMLPGMSGFRLAQTLRREDSITSPIIFLTARSAENDLLTGFSAGADDYIVKPFSVNEVIARVRAVLRRCRPQTAEQSEIEIEDVCLNTSNRTTRVGGKAVSLSRKEYDILELLMQNPGRTFSRSEIIERLWQDAPCILERTVDVHIARIRQKLGASREMITNRSGFGYSIAARCNKNSTKE